MAEIDISIIQRQLERILAANKEDERAAETLETGGAGPHDPGMEARVAKLEAHIEHIQSDIGEIKTDIRDIRRISERDFRILFSALIVGALGLAGLMAKGFHWIG